MQDNNMQKNPFNFNNQGGGQENPFANMFGQGMYEKKPLGQTIKRWLKITFYLVIFISFINGCTSNSTLEHGDLDRNTTIGQFWDMAMFFGAVFVFPLTQIAYIFNDLFSSFAPGSASVILSIFVIVVLVKGGSLVFMWNSIKQQAKMQEAQGKMAEIKAKYAGRTDQASKQQMQQEIMGLYSKMGINPLASMGAMFITMPFFFAMFRLISYVELFKDSTLLDHPFSESIVQSFNIIAAFDQPILLLLVVVTTVTQVSAMLLPQIQSARRRKASNKVMTAAAKSQLAQQQKMMYFMAIFFIFIIMNLSLGLTIYWLMTGIWSIFQTLLVQKKVHNKGKAKVVKKKVKYT